MLARTARLGAVLFGAALLITPAAGAATVSVSDGTIVFQSAVREANDVTAGAIAMGGGPSLTIADAGAPLTPGPGCTPVDAHTATCADPSGVRLPLVIEVDGDNDRVRVDEGVARSISVDGGAGRDDIQVGCSAGCPITIDGGWGDDTITSFANFAGSPVLHGGPGDDRVQLGQASSGFAYGDSGDDRLIYAGFFIPPAKAVLDGGSGNDTYTSSIGLAPIEPGSGIDTLDQRGTMETFSGFTFDSCTGCYDRVIGTAQGDEITGDGRSQIIVGSQGPDTLDGGGGADVLDGGDGDDVLRSRDGAIDVVRCGAGVDEVTADVFDVVARGCEAVSRAKLRR